MLSMVVLLGWGTLEAGFLCTDLLSRRNRPRRGDCLKPFTLRCVRGRELAWPNSSSLLTYLRFQRWAGCSICNLALSEFRRRADEIERAGVRTVIVVHSPPEEVLTFQDGMPFDFVADPDKELYRYFGVRSSTSFLLHPRTLATWRRSMLGGIQSNWRAHNGFFGLPADILLDGDGCVLGSQFGRQADDSWSVDALLLHAGEARKPELLPA